MNMINAKTRFALDGAGKIYDYLTNKTHEAVGILHDRNHGYWDMAHLAHLLRNGEHIDSSHMRNEDPAEHVAPPPAAMAAKDLTIHDLPNEAAPVQADLVEDEGQIFTVQKFPPLVRDYITGLMRPAKPGEIASE